MSRPQGVPDDWIEKPSKKGGGRIYHHPSNPHDSVRVMPGDSDSPHSAQQKPYVKRMKDGRALDQNGNPVDADSPEAHIPEQDFVFQE